MRNIVLIVIALALGIGTYFYFQSDEKESLSFEFQDSGSAGSAESRDTGSAMSDNGTVQRSLEGLAPQAMDDDDFDEEEEYDDRPAAEVYASLDEALAAVKQGALDYDDIVLEQFVEPGEDCTFCPALYKEVAILMKNPGATEDERAYYSELLAISGKKENIETLIDSIRTADDPDAADIYAESLELTIAGDDTVRYLSEFLEDKNELLQEASVAAITNQGSRLAAETLYEHTLQKGDADGYYDIGIGLGEFIPDEEALPYLQEITLKRDQYSHLAVKSLLNYGYDGLVIVFDALTNSANADFDKKMLEDAIDHVGYEEESEALAREILKNNPSPIAKEFAQEILDGFELDAELDEEEGF
jgi:hypothetical protein